MPHREPCRSVSQTRQNKRYCHHDGDFVPERARYRMGLRLQTLSRLEGRGGALGRCGTVLHSPPASGRGRERTDLTCPVALNATTGAWPGNMPSGTRLAHVHDADRDLGSVGTGKLFPEPYPQPLPLVGALHGQRQRTPASNNPADSDPRTPAPQDHRCRSKLESAARDHRMTRSSRWPRQSGQRHVQPHLVVGDPRYQRAAPSVLQFHETVARHCLQRP